MEEFHLIREALFDRNYDLSSYSFETIYYKRFVKAYFQSKKSLGLSDLAVLIRAILRYESEKQGAPMRLRVPNTIDWPSRTLWEKHSVSVKSEQNDSFLIEAEAWTPSWLEDGTRQVDRSVFQLKKRNNFEPILSDPFLHITGRKSYRSRSQRDAIRSILSAPKDSTLVINLPTGTGKSFCAQLPALLEKKSYGVTVVVVPTIALAMDQERAMNEFVDFPTAYVGGNHRKLENENIRAKIMDGTQTILFTSPESLLTSLHLPLQVAAERGFLRYFIIDEAHMVSGWGDEFRPAFQELAGFRQFLIKKTKKPFKTLLLSATVTEYCVDTLETMYGTSGPFRVFSAVQLRPEPEYWIHNCIEEENRLGKIVDALSHLPRPLIIYTSKVNDANTIYEYLRQVGYHRTSLMTGKTKNHVRESVIKDWQESNIDIVVATSAFGLGVDQSDVRAVIHACIPENLDRFYQEVGRGGRDGNACLSLLLYTNQDLKTAENLNHKIIIGIERGRQRWSRMFDEKIPVKNEPMTFKVPINVSPSFDEVDIDMDSEQNKAWNIRTLLLMSKTRLIDFLWEERVKDEEYTGIDYRLIRIKDQRHLDEEVWKEMIQPLRLRTSFSDHKNLELMKEFVQQKKCVSEVLSELYTIKERPNAPYRDKANVIKSCGGCPICRLEDRPFIMPTGVKSVPIRWEQENIESSWMITKYLSRKDFFFVFYPQSIPGDLTVLKVREQQKWKNVIRWLVEQGIQHIVGERDMLKIFTDDHRLFHGKVVFTTELKEMSKLKDWPSVPTIILHPPSKQFQRAVERLMTNHENDLQKIVFFLPEEITESGPRGRSYRDITSFSHMGFKEFLMEVGI